MSKFMKILEIILSIMVLFVTVLIFISVLFRYIFNNPIIFSFNLSTLIYAYIIFLGISLALKNDELIGVDIMVKRLSEKNKILFEASVYILMSVMVFVMIYYSIFLMINTRMELTAFEISARWLYASFPIGFGILLLNIIIKIKNILVRKIK